MWRNFHRRIVCVFSPERIAGRNFFLKRSMGRRKPIVSSTLSDSGFSANCVALPATTCPCKVTLQPYNPGYE